MDKLKEYLFPVEERKVYYEHEGVTSTSSYKSIVHGETGELISIMKDTYNLIPNEQIIIPLMEQLETLDSSWIIDPSHSYVDNNRMRLQITFPELTFNDGESDIALSLFVHNSYDGSEGVRLFWGAIRGICSNGMVFGKVLAKYYGRHTNGIQLMNMKERVEQTYEQIPVIRNRIEVLKRLSVSEETYGAIREELGANASVYTAQQPTAPNQWVLYNYLTWYISHVVDLRMRAAYQLKVSKLFKL